MTRQVSIEIPDHLWVSVKNHTDRHGRKEGESIIACLMADAVLYRSIKKPALIEYQQFLEWAGYRYCYQHAVYVNKYTRTAISIEFIEQSRSICDVIPFVTSTVNAGENWLLEFTSNPSEAVATELSKSLDALYPIGD